MPTTPASQAPKSPIAAHQLAAGPCPYVPKLQSHRPPAGRQRPSPHTSNSLRYLLTPHAAASDAETPASYKEAATPQVADGGCHRRTASSYSLALKGCACLPIHTGLKPFAQLRVRSRELRLG